MFIRLKLTEPLEEEIELLIVIRCSKISKKVLQKLVTKGCSMIVVGKSSKSEWVETKGILIITRICILTMCRILIKTGIELLASWDSILDQICLSMEVDRTITNITQRKEEIKMQDLQKLVVSVFPKDTQIKEVLVMLMMVDEVISSLIEHVARINL